MVDDIKFIPRRLVSLRLTCFIREREIEPVRIKWIAFFQAVGDFLFLPWPTHLLLGRVMAYQVLFNASGTSRYLARTFELSLSCDRTSISLMSQGVSEDLRHSSQAA